ncbi:hypothetical protein V8C42DRAFT_362978 [Trichoderma barbatum]
MDEDLRLEISALIGGSLFKDSVRNSGYFQDAGHVLVHYLVTGTYLSLKPRLSSPQEEIAIEFSTSVRAYAVAKTYERPNLAEFAKAEVERLGERLHASLAFDLLRDAYSNPDGNYMWLTSYLKNRLNVFLKNGNMDPFVGETSAVCDNVSMSSILFKSMFELLRENTVSLRLEFNGTSEKQTGDFHPFNQHL